MLQTTPIDRPGKLGSACPHLVAPLMLALILTVTHPALGAQLPLPGDATTPAAAEPDAEPPKPETKTRLAEIERTIGLLEAWMARHRDKEGEEPTAEQRAAALTHVQLELAYAQNPWIARSTAIVEALERQIREAKLYAARDDVPTIVRLQRRVRDRRRAIFKAREKIRAELEPQLRRQIADGLGTDQPIPGAQVLKAIDGLKQDKAVLESGAEDKDRAEQ